MTGQIWKMAWNAVGANKLRTFLTMLGIIIGVVSLVVLVSIAGGASGTVSDKISGMGSSYLTVRINDDKENPLRLGEFTGLFQDEEAIAAAAPSGRMSATAKSGYTSGSISLTGTTGSYFEIMNLKIGYGRNLKQTDQDNHSSVVILTADTARELFGYENAVGETLSLDGRSFLVAGVLSGDNSSLTSDMGSVQSEEEETESVSLQGYIPYATLTRMADNVLDITQFYVSSAQEDSMTAAQLALQGILLDRFGQDEDAFTITDQSEIMEAMDEINNTMALMLGGIAAISLLVGGIGIMNIMLVSVTERTREIGIRKAVGAGKGSILAQFLMEALIVSVLGCLAGILFSWVILEIAARIMGDSMQVEMSWSTAGLAVLFSAVLGVVFGLYPAGKAAAKKPIDALRYSG